MGSSPRLPPIGHVLLFGAAQRDRNLIGVDRDPFDMLAYEFQVPEVIAGLSCPLTGSPRLFYCLADEGLDIGRR